MNFFLLGHQRRIFFYPKMLLTLYLCWRCALLLKHWIHSTHVGSRPQSLQEYVGSPFLNTWPQSCGGWSLSFRDLKIVSGSGDPPQRNDSSGLNNTRRALRSSRAESVSTAGK